MKNIKIISIIALLATGLVFSACEDKLDILKHGNLGSMEDFYLTDADAEAALVAVYTAWAGGYMNWYLTKNALSDDVWAGGNDRGDNADLHYLNEYTFGTEHGYIEQLYSSYYSIIYNANLIIENVEPDSDVKKRAIAEAKFFRAWAHFELVSLWEIAPVVDHVLQSNEYRQPTGNPETTWAFVEKDLTEAINSGALPSKSNKDDVTTAIRITKEVAQAILGKAYVFQKKWPEAAQTLDEVIASGKYDLYRGDYGDVLKMVANNSCEAILEQQVRFDLNNPTFNILHVMVGWRVDKMNTGAANPAFADLGYDSGYGQMQPTKSLYDAFVAREGANGYRLSQTMITSDFLKDVIGITIRETIHGNEGYFFWKNRSLKSESVIDIPGFRGLQAVNNRVMRYAEVLLLAAEAHVMKDGDASGKAKAYINEIRTRARLAPLGNVTMDDVKIEKRLELCAESVRFQDLVRWGDAPVILANQGKDVRGFNGTNAVVQYSNSVYGFKAGTHERLPIPAKERMVNGEMGQNPGWGNQ
jgi:hypothetical protein